MRKATLGKEFARQLADKNRRYSETAGDAVARKATLRSNIEWANNADTRANDELKHRRSEYHVKKAAWNMTAGTDEEPREYFHLSRKARNYRIGAFAALFVEVIISSLMFYSLLTFGWPFAVTAIVSVLIATVVTLGLAYVLHGAVSYLVDSRDPAVSLRRLLYILVPSLVLIVLSIIAYVAIQRLDPITLLTWQPILSSAKFVAMLGLLGLGVSLLVGADIYDWNAEPAAEYQELQSIRQEISSYKREWTDELNGTAQMIVNNTTVNNTTAVIVNTAPEVKANPDVSTNGNKPTIPVNSTVTSLLALFFVAVALIMSACAAPEAQLSLTPVAENIEVDCVIDASGVKNYSALQDAGRNFFANSPEIVKQHNIKRFSVLWFGANGWTPESKLTLDMPVRMRASAPRRDMGDIGTYRPDVVEAEKKLNDEQIKTANASLDEKYQVEVKDKFSGLDFDALLPPADKETTCTDLNGLIGHYAQPDSLKLHLIYVITDARQNCGEEYKFQKIRIPPNKLFIFIIVPGTEADGLADYELRRANILAGCPSCLVVPFHRKDLSIATMEAVEKRVFAQK
jgi:hypothetical protein